MHRLTLCFLAALALLAPTPAAAEEETTTWTLVVDEGASRGAEESASLRRMALDVAQAARARGHLVRFLAAGAKKDGTPALAELRRTGKASDRSSRLTAWAKEVGEAKFHEEGRASATASLKGVLERHEEEGPLIVLFVGSFQPPPVEDDESGDEGADEEDAPAPDPRAEAEAAGVQTWTEDAPAGSRAMALAGLAPESFDSLRALPGFVAGGFVILEAGTYDARTAPYSPLQALLGLPTKERQRAEGELLLRTLALAPAEKPGTWAPLRAVLDFEVTDSDDNKDLAFVEPREGRLALHRSPLGGPTLELAFAWKESGARPAVPLCDPPPALTLKWLELRPHAHLVQREPGARVAIVATDIPGPHIAHVRVLRTVSDPERRWWWQPEDGEPTTELPAGLSLVEEEAPVAEDGPGRRLIRSITVRLRFSPQPGLRTSQWKGKLLYKPRNSKIDELRVRVDVRSGAPRVSLEGPEAEPSVVLPRTSEAAGIPLRISTRGEPRPARVALALSATAVTGTLPTLVWRVRGKGGISAPVEGAAARVDVPVDEDLELLVDLTPGAPPTDVQGALRVTVPAQEDLQATGTVTSTFRTRRPRLRLAELRPELRVEGGELVIDPPLRLELDADGADGPWLLARMRKPPVVRGRLGDLPAEAWTVESEAPGIWRARPSGPWTGLTPAAFEDQEQTLHMEVTWPDGPAPEALDLVVVIPARWGVRGWLFVGLAVLALALATFTFLQVRPPPITGTLLYTAEGLERTVGRLDLEPVGRSTAILRADKQGRLSLGTSGEAIAVLRPTRVAGTIEVPGEDGTPEKRLLVDGLTVRIGAHAVRYISGQPTDEDMAKPLIDVPDLLGPEFDVGSGRFDAEVPQLGENTESHKDD